MNHGNSCKSNKNHNSDDTGNNDGDNKVHYTLFQSAVSDTRPDRRDSHLGANITQCEETKKYKASNAPIYRRVTKLVS